MLKNQHQEVLPPRFMEQVLRHPFTDIHVFRSAESFQWLEQKALVWKGRTSSVQGECLMQCWWLSGWKLAVQHPEAHSLLVHR